MCLRMLKERAVHWRVKYWHKAIGSDKYESGMCEAYENAIAMLEYAMKDNIECLRQFDCYHKEEEHE